VTENATRGHITVTLQKKRVSRMTRFKKTKKWKDHGEPASQTDQKKNWDKKIQKKGRIYEKAIDP